VGGSQHQRASRDGNRRGTKDKPEQGSSHYEVLVKAGNDSRWDEPTAVRGLPLSGTWARDAPPELHRGERADADAVGPTPFLPAASRCAVE
jgi:hypothetical protein